MLRVINLHAGDLLGAQLAAESGMFLRSDLLVDAHRKLAECVVKFFEVMMDSIGCHFLSS